MGIPAGFVFGTVILNGRRRSDVSRRRHRPARSRVVSAIVKDQNESFDADAIFADEFSTEKKLPYQELIGNIVNAPATDAFVSMLVLAQCVCFAVASIPIDVFLRQALEVLDVSITGVFVFEYFLRWYSGGGLRPRYLAKKIMIIDLLAILPPFLSMATDYNLQFVRLLRVVRIFRLQRVLQKKEFYRLFGIKSAVSETNLRIAEVMVTVFSILYVSSGFLYEAEVEVNGAIDNFFDAFYFMVVTLTTVGFGDITPVTPLGKLVVSCSIITGILYIPYQFGRLAEAVLGDMGMIEMMGKARNTEKIECLSCGTKIHPSDSSYCRICGSRLRSS
ncbi:hypothetical protein NDN08_001046 [Rhodosorus marinus]|uniref:Ion transport domain-containing protein n=1 Tax=Rhodosorus marinus TaxID=101924 RepID=A0AAV8USH6_9RHOD|nr:hypothetical protein NDN08_001046 [Rhodosorus marinus]